jgi:hypothetical protein
VRTKAATRRATFADVAPVPPSTANVATLPKGRRPTVGADRPDAQEGAHGRQVEDRGLDGACDSAERNGHRRVEAARRLVHPAVRGVPEWFVFAFGSPLPNDPTRPITSFKTAWSKVRQKAGVKGRWHDNRHTLATELAEGGARRRGEYEHRWACVARHALALLPRADGGKTAGVGRNRGTAARIGRETQGGKRAADEKHKREEERQLQIAELSHVDMVQ